MVGAASASDAHNSLRDIELSHVVQQGGDLRSVVASRECDLDGLARLTVGQHILDGD